MTDTEITEGGKRGSRILLVEDHEPLLMCIQCVLEEEGYTVFTATDGAQALRVVEETGCPDLIISDVMMPRMDGYALLTAMRARPEWMFVPFIFLTARAEKEDALRAKELGAEDCIAKPFSPRKLMVAINLCLERHETREQRRTYERRSCEASPGG